MSILVTPSDGLFMTIYTKLTLKSRWYERFHAVFRRFENFLLRLSFREVYETFRGIFRVVHEIF